MRGDNARETPPQENVNPHYAAACQTDFACPQTREEIADRTETMCRMVEQTINIEQLQDRIRKAQRKVEFRNGSGG